MRSVSLKRSERFHVRIALERSILDIVNGSRLGLALPLTGLTSAAINEWLRRSTGHEDAAHVKHVVPLVQEIARASGLIVDQSRAIMEPDDEETSSEIERLKTRLTSVVRARFN